MWPDEEIRSFYEDLPDLASRIPPVLLGLEKGEKVEKAEKSEKEKEEKEEPSRSEPVLSAEDEKELEQAGNDTDQEAVKPKTPLDLFMVVSTFIFQQKKFCHRFL